MQRKALRLMSATPGLDVPLFSPGYRILRGIDSGRLTKIGIRKHSAQARRS
jgi:hypothetical protein